MLFGTLEDDDASRAALWSLRRPHWVVHSLPHKVESTTAGVAEAMILDSMPGHERSGESLRFIGFWYSGSDPELPVPWDYVNGTWDHAERMRVVQYLRTAPEVHWFLGFSGCRICGCRNGSTDRSDGTFLWPDGFAHYVERHGVKPSEEFLEHVRRALLP